MNRLIKHILFVVGSLFAGALSAQTAGVVAELDSNLAETGNPFKLHLFVPQQIGEPSAVDFSPWDSVISKQNILQQSDWRLEGNRWAKDVTLIAFDADTVTMPPLPISLKNGETVLSNSLELSILATPSPEDIASANDIKDIHREPINWSDYLFWGIATLILFVLGALGYWLLNRRRRRKKEAVSRSIELPAHVLALKKLEALHKKQLWQIGAVKLYYGELSFILREYLQKRYGIPALESTSDLTLNLLRKNEAFPGEYIPQVAELLQQADLAKFAKATPPESFHEAALHGLIRFVQETVPPPPAETEPNTETKTQQT